MDFGPKTAKLYCSHYILSAKAEKNKNFSGRLRCYVNSRQITKRKPTPNHKTKTHAKSQNEKFMDIIIPIIHIYRNSGIANMTEKLYNLTVANKFIRHITITWRRIEVVITSRTRNAVTLRGAWVRIPPSPPKGDC